MNYYVCYYLDGESLQYLVSFRTDTGYPVWTSIKEKAGKYTEIEIAGLACRNTGNILSFVYGEKA